MLLPAVAFIGGGGEVAYWLELKPVFEHYKVNFPPIFLRNSLLWIDKGQSKKLQKLDLKPTDLFQKTDRLLKKYVQKNTSENLELALEKQEIEKIFEDILKRAKNIDPGLEKTVLGEKQNQLNSLTKLEAKLLKAEKNKFDTALSQIRNLQEKLFPNGGLQERHDNFIAYYLKYGEDFFQKLIENIDPLEPEFTILTERETT
jgi:uncharacterized protein YllA (UPF0747 family)